MAFEYAHSLTGRHLIVQPSDASLNPPESYLFVQDFLIISCGVLYAFCYFFYMLRTVKDKTLAGPVEFLCGTMAYEIFYAYIMTDTAFERAAFFMWFLLDVTFVAVAIKSAYPAEKRLLVSARTAAGVLVGLGFFRYLVAVFPDEREQVTAYWTGWLLQLPIGWGTLWLLVRDQSKKGHSLEIWITRFLGCLTAYGVFLWRYINVPQNWEYVGTPLSTALIVLTVLPELFYPFVYLRVHNKLEKQKRA